MLLVTVIFIILSCWISDNVTIEVKSVMTILFMNDYSKNKVTLCLFTSNFDINECEGAFLR